MGVAWVWLGCGHNVTPVYAPEKCPFSDQQDFKKAQTILHDHPFKWERIAQDLGFKPNEISTIKATPTLLAGAPMSYLDAMLEEWQQWAPGDARGSTCYATLETLRKAVSKAGLGLIAQQL